MTNTMQTDLKVSIMCLFRRLSCRVLVVIAFLMRIQGVLRQNVVWLLILVSIKYLGFRDCYT